MQPISNGKRTLYASLSQVKFRRKHGLFRVEGKKSVKDVIGRYVLEALLVTEDFITRHNEFLQYADNVYICKQSDINHISGLTTPTDVIAICHIPDTNDKDDILSSPLPSDKLYLLLDGIQDPGNMGTIIRTAHWFGVRDIFISESSVDVYNPKTVQATMGSLPYVNIHRVDLIKAIEMNPGMPVYGLLLDGENIYKSELGSYGFIAMGNEGNGLSEALRKKITTPLTIPPYFRDDHSESLNVATATAVTLALFRSKDS